METIRAKTSLKKVTCVLLMLLMLIGMMPMQAFGAAGDQFTVGLTMTYANGDPFDPATTALANGKKIKLRLNIQGANANGATIDPLATFKVQIPKVFAALADMPNNTTGIEIPQDDSGSGPLFEYTGPMPGSEPAYLEYTFRYSTGYKASLAAGSAWTFSTATLIMNLDPSINTDTSQYNNPIKVKSDEVVKAETDEFELPAQYSSLSLSKSLASIVRYNTDTQEWENLRGENNASIDNYYFVKPGDIIMYRIITSNRGNIPGEITVTETLPAGLEAYDEPYESTPGVYTAAYKTIWGGGFAYNKTNLEPRDGLPAFIAPEEPAAWEKQPDGTYKITVCKRGSADNPYALFFAKVKPLVGGVAWTDDQLKNVVSSGDLVASPEVGKGPTSHPELLPDAYDVALQKWAYKVERDGFLMGYVQANPYTADTLTYPGDLITFSIRVTNQSRGNSPVKIGEIVDYLPRGLVYEPNATAYANGWVSLDPENYTPDNPGPGDPDPDDFGWTTDGTTATSPLSDSFQKAAGEVTLYKFNYNKIIKTAAFDTVFLCCSVKDLDTVIAEVDSTKAIQAGSTKTEIEKNRDLLRIGTIYIPYYNAAEVATAYTLKSGGIATDPADFTDQFVEETDVDSWLDIDPFNDIKGNKSVEDYGKNDWMNGKEIDNEINQNGRTFLEDEDDYDFAKVRYAPKPVKEEGSTDIGIKRWDKYPLLHRAYGSAEVDNMSKYLTILMKQLTKGNVPTAVMGDGTGRVYGTNAAGAYLNANNGTLIMPYTTGTGITNSYPSNENAALARPLSDYKIAEFSSDKKTVLVNGTDTILMYTVAVNGDGMTNMENVELTDTVPDGFKLLKDINGNPIVRITRYLPATPGQGVVIGSDGKPEVVDMVDRGSATTPVSNPGTFRVYDVKQFTSYDYLDANHPSYPDLYRDWTGNPLTIPMPGISVAADQVEYWKNKISNVPVVETIDGLNYTKDSLKVTLGDIGYGSYDVSFLVVSDRIMAGSTVLKNTATITYKGGKTEATATDDIRWDQGAMASFFKKDIIVSEGAAEKTNPLSANGDVTVKYRVALKSTDVDNPTGKEIDILPNQIKVMDQIRVPDDATLESVGNISIEAKSYDKATGNETLVPETAIKVADVTFDSDEEIVTIQNSGPMVQNRRYYITFDVSYSDVPSGSIINNVLGDTVRSYVPVEINLVKTDEGGTEMLENAEFTAYYPNTAGDAPDETKPLSVVDKDGNPIVGSKVTTDVDGKASLFFSPSAEEFNAITADDPFVFFLKETGFPDGYYSANDVIVKFTVRRNADDTLLIVNEGNLVTNAKGSIEQPVSNKEGEAPLGIRTSAHAEGSASKVIKAETTAKIVDTVSYTGLTIGTKYTLKGTLMDKSTGETLKINGAEVTATADFTPTTKNGTADLTFTFDASGLAGKSLVVYEKLFLADDLTNVIARHENINDVGQTVTVEDEDAPEISIRTSAHAAGSVSKVIEVGATAQIVDTVSYTGLTPGTKYRLEGKLMDKSTGAALKINGTEITASTEFTPPAADGTVALTFTFDASGLAGKSLVVFEKLFLVDAEIAKHEDINDKDQTVTLEEKPTTRISISTSAHAEGNTSKIIKAEANAKIVDTVSYTGLTVGTKYTLKGTLMDKSTGTALKINGTEVTATAEFTPTAANGTVDLTFTFDASGLAGKSLVVFEKLFLVDAEIANHEDINDEGQTVTVEEEVPEISIRTSAKGKATGTKTVKAEENVTIVDTVTYTGLTVGKTYTVKGTLMDKSTGQPLLIGGSQVTAEKTFTATAANGTVDLEFTFNASALAGKTLVVFEKLFLDGTEVATHEDLNDVAQTVTVDTPVEESFFVSKRQITGDDELPGAKLTIYETDAQGNKTTTIAKTTSGESLTWTSGTTPRKIEGLAAGTYVLHEDTAPVGYDLATDIKFTLSADSKVTSSGEVTSDAKTLIMRDKLKSIDGGGGGGTGSGGSGGSGGGTDVNGGGNDTTNIPVTGEWVPILNFLLAVAFLAIATLMIAKRHRRRTNR